MARLIRLFKNRIFRSDVIFPDSAVKINPTLEFLKQSQPKQRQRVIDFVNQNKGIPIDIQPKTSKTKLSKRPANYYIKKEIYGPEHPIHQFLQVDKRTNLPYKLGFDDFIKGVREAGNSQEKQDRLRDIARKVGFQSLKDMAKKIQSPGLHKKMQELSKLISYSKYEITQNIHQQIAREKYPRSQTYQQPPQQYFSDQEYERAQRKLQGRIDKFTQQILGPEYLNSSDKQLKVRERQLKRTSSYLTQVSNIFTPKWVLDVKNVMNKKRHRAVQEKLERMVSNHYFQARRSPFKTIDPQGIQDAQYFQMMKKKHQFQTPTFEELVNLAQEYIQNEKNFLSVQSKKDKMESNLHFLPQYLNRDIQIDLKNFNFIPSKESSIYTQVITGDFDMSMDPQELINLTNHRRQFQSKEYKPSTADNVPAKIYHTLQADPVHKHYLVSHIKYTIELQKDLSPNDFGLPIQRAPLIPWEIPVPQSSITNKKTKKTKIIIDQLGRSIGSGKRKRARAIAFIKPGLGNITVNKKPFFQYFHEHVARDSVVMPFKETQTMCQFDVSAQCFGGGQSGQAQALRKAIAVALCNYEPNLKPILEEAGLLLSDGRNVERKKTSKVKARKSYTFVKR